MKNTFRANGFFGMVLLMVVLNITVITFAQSGKNNSSPIPENIYKIFQVSCMSCHSDKGGRFPRARLNFSKWAEYDAAKKQEKASLICSTLIMAEMPPRTAREKKPQLIPTKEQISLICDWVESLKTKMGGK
jgi:hypothetical protein